MVPAARIRIDGWVSHCIRRTATERHRAEMQPVDLQRPSSITLDHANPIVYF